MPIYEYHCPDCGHRVSLLFRSFADAESKPAVCPRCSGTHLRRLVSRVAVIRSESSRFDDAGDPGEMDAPDQNDPQAMARWMRKMANDSGEELGPEFDEVVGRLEAGEDPEAIEKSMPEMADAGGEGAGPDADGGDFGSGGYDGGDDFGVA
jgi:putative FmdB family regulatory protein